MSLHDYECVIGLEVHAELKTATKIFCGCPTTFGAPPNTQCCPVCTGMPGALPVLNREVVRLAVRAGLALGCTIARFSKLDRKNYVYPDLPKAYQISQYDAPLCVGGHLDVDTPNGARRVGITRIHIEEDAGKLVHLPGEGTLLDCNRCGVPLIEIVSEPDIRSAEEAKSYVQSLRAVLLAAGVSDCRMNEGSLRCDVNLSVRKKGETALGTRTEMKNLNSFQSIYRAVEVEFRRQVELIEAGGTVEQETRRFDAATGTTSAMRRKENADDYRYFPDPDLPPVTLTEREIEDIRAELPALPDENKREFIARFGLSEYAAGLLIRSTSAAQFFRETAAKTRYPKVCANLLIGGVLPSLGEEDAIALDGAKFAALCNLSGDGRLSSTAAQRVLAAVLEGADPEAYMREHGLEQVSDDGALRETAEQVIVQNEKIVRDLLGGKQAALQALVGQGMRLTRGKANPEKLADLLRETLGL
ncbi:MAG: glutaminyl-tRNA synthase (glutamine-hydrolyzing) subunit B [Clostridium sp. SCN 57-10]|nr:MAG: glutaminyl-tRNA synthase (glutamine-hydrolyzing) subunit B [Clostridium sp. SCN 57-10]